MEDSSWNELSFFALILMGLIPVVITLLFIYLLFHFIKIRTSSCYESYNDIIQSNLSIQDNGDNEDNDYEDYEDFLHKILEDNEALDASRKRIHYEDRRKQITDLLNIYVPGNNDSNLFYVSDRLILDDIQQLVYIRNKIREKIKTFIHNNEEYILFFEDINFQGKMYLIPLKKMNDESDIIVKWDIDNKSLKEEKNNGLQFPRLEDINREEHKKTTTFGNFIRQFRFYTMRRFSVIIPNGYEVCFYQFDLETDDRKLELNSGFHNIVEFNLPSLKKCTIKNI